jgi:hypothetical protein
LTGGDATTLWKNEVAPRGLLQMMRYRPALDAARLQAPLLVCAAEHDREAPVYTDPALRERALADQLQFLHEHLHPSSRVA